MTHNNFKASNSSFASLELHPNKQLFLLILKFVHQTLVFVKGLSHIVTNSSKSREKIAGARSHIFPVDVTGLGIFLIASFLSLLILFVNFVYSFSILRVIIQLG